MVYQIVVGDDPDDLARRVNHLIGEGWQPLGGLAIGLPASLQVQVLPIGGALTNKLIFCQAMSK